MQRLEKMQNLYNWFFGMFDVLHNRREADALTIYALFTQREIIFEINYSKSQLQTLNLILSQNLDVVQDLEDVKYSLCFLI